MHPLIHDSRFLNILWVIPGSIFVITVLFTYLKFLNHLPNKTKLLFLTAGTIYVGGAVGLELIGNYLVGDSGIHTFLSQMVVSVEECFEMSGIAIFIYALLSYLQDLLGNGLPPVYQEENNHQEISVEFSTSEKVIKQ
jgi:hypothetical protein